MIDYVMSQLIWSVNNYHEIMSKWVYDAISMSGTLPHHFKSTVRTGVRGKVREATIEINRAITYCVEDFGKAERE